MSDQGSISYDSLVTKVRQQEETIVQLLVIIAATNRKISDLIELQDQRKHSLSHS
ncbi:hypothetical protein [Virgibacillus sp. DJP39]|uniref:hypothetical protein n=1 Tax=Virgibacillus sp. DJP39 TaxID=3409790 RepID=UPI003BB4A946